MSKDRIESFKVVAGTGTPFDSYTQLWRFNKDGHLENKMREWSKRYKDSETSITPEGFIEVQEIGKVCKVFFPILKHNANTIRQMKLSMYRIILWIEIVQKN